MTRDRIYNIYKPVTGRVATGRLPYKSHMHLALDLCRQMQQGDSKEFVFFFYVRIGGCYYVFFTIAPFFIRENVSDYLLLRSC